MKRRLFWKLSVLVVAGSILLVIMVNWLSIHTEQQMSFIDAHHQQTLRDYARKAESYYQQNDLTALENFLNEVRQRENTWVAVVESDLTPVAGSQLLPRFLKTFALGRDVSWKIHLYFKENPIMDLTFASGHTHFLILLPQHMRPGSYWPATGLLLQILLPVVLMSLISLLIYRHVMQPLKQLQQATRQFSQGNHQVRVLPQLGKRQDEMTELASAFDQMAARIGRLIKHQQHLTADLSHELRTPLTRIELALDMAMQNQQQTALAQIRTDCVVMRSLVEDTLMLAWLDREQPALRNENFDLSDLVDSIADNCRFEFPDKSLTLLLPEQAPLQNSNSRALGQALENILRNALRHTASGGNVSVALTSDAVSYLLKIADAGPGVSDEFLVALFRPFFRLPSTDVQHFQGFGLGLSLAKRHIECLGGTIRADNRRSQGLLITLTLPVSANSVNTGQTQQM